MKEPYFLPETIAGKAQQMQIDFAPFARERVKFKPDRSALLILDMQRYFLDADSHAYIPSADAILPRVDALRETYATLGLPIVWTRHLNTPADAQGMSRWWRDLVVRENPKSEIHPFFSPAADTVIEKTQYDAFHETILNPFLHERGIEQVVIAGVMTHLCCETTARSAFMHGYDVFFLIDGTATYSEVFHRAALQNLVHGFAALVLSEEIRLTTESTEHIENA